MTVLVADCETDGLLDELTKLHCLGFVDLDTNELHTFADQPGHRPIVEGLELLAKAETTVWHNGIKFDIPVIRKVYPWWKPAGVVRDSMLTASLVWPKNPTLYDIDRKLTAKGKLPKHLMGRHSLEAWGYRVGEWKGDYKGGWAAWSPEMHEYMGQDCRSTAALWRRTTEELATWKSQECVDLEHEVAWIIARQERRGVCFDIEAAEKLAAELTRKHVELEQELLGLFPPKTIKVPFTPARDNKTKGYKKGVTVFKEKVVEFNPASRDQIAERLIEKYGWKPTERTTGGKWKIDDDILSELPYPEAKRLADYFLLEKRLGTLINGKGALLTCGKTGRIHGRCDSNGTVTGRATHSNPNVNLPQADKPWGPEFRRLFKAGPGMVLVGTDADSLEARVEAGFTVKYDGGSYRELILTGDKDKGTDLHTRNAKAITPIVPVSRQGAKAIKYAWTYGAGNVKLGLMAGATPQRAGAVGGRIRKRLLAASPGLAGLVAEVERSLEKRPHLWGLDGRKLIVRSQHAAVNTLFQSAGSIIFKKAMVLRDRALLGCLPSAFGTRGADASSGGLMPGADWEQVLWVHDEVQCEATPEYAGLVARTMEDAIRRAGEHFKFNCAMGGNSDIGDNWAATH